MARIRIPLLDAPELEKREAYYAARHDEDARLILRLIADCRWYRTQYDMAEHIRSGVPA